MLFPQKMNTSAKGPKWAGMRHQTWLKWMDEFVCYCFCWELWAFYGILMNPSCNVYIMEELSNRNWCIKEECGPIQRRSWSQSTSVVNEITIQKITIKKNYHINKCSIHKMVSFRNKCDLFATEARIYLKGVLITFHVCEKRCKPLFPKDVYWNSLFFFLALRAPSWALASSPMFLKRTKTKIQKNVSVQATSASV